MYLKYRATIGTATRQPILRRSMAYLDEGVLLHLCGILNFVGTRTCAASEFVYMHGLCIVPWCVTICLASIGKIPRQRPVGIRAILTTCTTVLSLLWRDILSGVNAVSWTPI